MKYLVQLTGCLLLFCYASDSFAQKLKSKVPAALSLKEAVVIDGKLSEWGDSLLFLYNKQQLQFAVANDDKHVYVAMRVQEGPMQMQALRQGFNFMINTDGKKKDGASIAFPVPDRESLRALMGADNEEKPKDIRLVLLKAIRAIYVKGLVDVVDGPVALDNDYGIQARIMIDSKNAVCYEASIPLERLGLRANQDKILAFNVKIDGGIEAHPEPGVWFFAPLARP